MLTSSTALFTANSMRCAMQWNICTLSYFLQQCSNTSYSTHHGTAPSLQKPTNCSFRMSSVRPCTCKKFSSDVSIASAVACSTATRPKKYTHAVSSYKVRRYTISDWSFEHDVLSSIMTANVLFCWIMCFAISERICLPICSTMFAHAWSDCRSPHCTPFRCCSVTSLLCSAKLNCEWAHS